MSHIPVLLNEVLQMMAEGQRPVRRFLDGTFGRGGHTKAVFEKFPGVMVVAFDRDNTAIEYGRKNFAAEILANRLSLIHRNYSEVSQENVGLFDAILLDLGVSSPQLDEADRGFSFYEDGPLDMRMDRRDGITAASIVNEWEPDSLLEVFRELGEIPRPQRVVNAIVKDRQERPFETTRQLASMIERVDGWSRKGHHPATRYFMALRLQVNRELEDVHNGVAEMIDHLEPGGRLMVITFHSLEDRIVKNLFKNSKKGVPVNKKVITPGREEETQNPRSRSAKLRGFEKAEV